MALPETVLTLAGFALAHGAITASTLPSTESLAPFAIVEQDGVRRLVRFDAGNDPASIRRCREAVRQFGQSAQGWAFVRPGRMRAGGRATEVLVIEFKGGNMDQEGTLLQGLQRHKRHSHYGEHARRHGHSGRDDDRDNDRDNDDRRESRFDRNDGKAPVTPTPPPVSVDTPPATAETPPPPPPADTTTPTDPARTTTEIVLAGVPVLVTSGTVPDTGTVQNVRTTTQYSLSTVQQGVQLYPDGAALLATALPAQ